MKPLWKGLSKLNVVAVFLVLCLANGFSGFAMPGNPQGQASTGIAGEWQGTLKAGEAELRLVLHIAKNEDGSYKATMDSIDQGANGMPVTSMTLEGSKLNFALDSIQGSYEGTVSADGSTISGTWSQAGNSLPLEFKRAAAPIKTTHKPAKPSDIDGAWLGTLDAGGTTLRLAFHITNTEDGLTATMDSLDQGAKGIPATGVKREGDSLTIEMKQIGGDFQGTINKDRTEIDGNWSQMGNTLPLVLKRVKDQAQLEPPRPQNPTGPLPYRHEDVTFENQKADIRLAGTLTIPQGQGPFPAAVLIAGSGPHGRDETVFGHKPFLVLSDYLTRHGIEVLRYDKRGVGKSGGSEKTATTADFADDAQAAFNYLRSQPDVNPNKIGLIGHSEGAVIAPMVAARDSQVDFVVMMAGSGVPGEEILVEQSLLLSEAAGMGKDKSEQNAAEEREVLDIVKKESDNAVLEKELREKLAGKIPEAQLGTQVKVLGSPWFRYFISYNPATALEKITCPVLVLSGEKDLQVPPKQNLPAIRKALEAAGNKHFEIDELPGLNHLFQPAKTGSPAEYASIEITIAPEVLEKISGWILKQ